MSSGNSKLFLAKQDEPIFGQELLALDVVIQEME